MAKKIIISGEIGFSLQPNTIRAELEGAKGQDIDIYIASPGGSVYDGLEIYNMLKSYRRDHKNAKINFVIQGLAASMASYIACCPAADKVVAENNAIFMVHNPWSAIVGDHREMQKSAEVLAGLAALLSRAYAERTGKTPEDMQKLMDSETWYFGEEIKAAGFVDEIIDAEDKDAGKDKASSLAAARVAVSSVAAKMREDTKAKEDLQKAAAMITSSAPAQTPAPSGSPAPAPTARTGGTLDLDAIDPASSSTFVVGDVGRNTPAGSAPGTPAPQIPRTAAELRAQAPGLYAELVTEARAAIETERKRQEETERVPALLGLKKQLKASPLFAGISEIVEEGIAKGQSFHDTLLAVVKWSASGSAVASLETAPGINTGMSPSASGEKPTPRGDNRKGTLEA